MKSLTALCILILILQSCKDRPGSDRDWDTYLGDYESSQYVDIDQITKDNVKELKVAWTYDAGEAHPKNWSQIQCNPLIIDGIMYGTTATRKLVALNGANGELIWTFDPYKGADINYGLGVNRGLMYTDHNNKNQLFYSIGNFIYSLDPDTGDVITSFGTDGRIDLSENLAQGNNRYVYANTPGVIYKDKLIIGGRVSEGPEAAPGHIRAFNIYTGKQEWIFHTIPKPGEYGYDSWPPESHLSIGGANVWTGMALDIELGVVFCPTGSASYDFYGGNRIGDNLFANSLIALNAETGERIWHYQFVHHDIWDKDLPASPNLIEIEKDGAIIKAVAQITKTGEVYVFNRQTGESLFEITEIPVPSSKLAGEVASITQAISTGLPRFSRNRFEEEDVADRSDSTYEYSMSLWKSMDRSGGMFTPPSESGTLIFPGFDGGGEWGGAAFDPVNKDLIVNSNEVPWRTIMDKVNIDMSGQSLFQVYCQSCHGKDLRGNDLYGNMPSLIGLTDRLTLGQVTTIIKNGRGMMPQNGTLTDSEIGSIYEYLSDQESSQTAKSKSTWPLPYVMRGYEKLIAPDGYPIINPPWGQLTSINLERASINWQIPLGHHESLTGIYERPTGTQNYGGPIITSSDLIFIAATSDEKIRAFDKTTGEEVWSYKLPYAAYATPAIYKIDGKQYIVVACGGGKLGTDSGDVYVAFSL